MTSTRQGQTALGLIPAQAEATSTDPLAVLSEYGSRTGGSNYGSSGRIEEDTLDSSDRRGGAAIDDSFGSNQRTGGGYSSERRDENEGYGSKTSEFGSTRRDMDDDYGRQGDSRRDADQSYGQGDRDLTGGTTGGYGVSRETETSYGSGDSYGSERRRDNDY